MALVNPLAQLNGILSQMVAGQLGSAVAGPAVAEHLAPVEASGVLHPDDARDLRRLAGGETLQPGRLAEIATRTGLLHAIGSGQVPPKDMYDRYLRIVGGSTPSLLPTSLRPRTSRAIQIRPEGMEDKIFCPVCNVPNPQEANYCLQCSARLGEDVPPTLPAKKKKATILFTDFKGFSAVSQGLEPEVIGEMLNRYFDALGAQIMIRGGRFNKNIGDSIMGAFGAFETYDDHAIRAVQTAMEMQQVLEKMNEQLAIEGKPLLKMRIGVNTGWVWAGILGGPGNKQFDILGDAVNVASRLEGQAEPGRILISDETLAELNGRFKVERKGPVKVKNIDRLIDTYHVVAEIPSDAAVRARGQTEVALRGREKELQRLQEDFDAVAEGQPNLTVVVGQAGHGKSRLVAEFLKSVRDPKDRNIVVLSAKGINLPAHQPNETLAAALRLKAGIAPNDSQEDLEMKVLNLIRLTVGGNDESVKMSAQILGNLMGVSFTEKLQEMQHLLIDHAALRDRTYEEVIRYFDSLTQRQPVIFVLEDMHWIDPESLKLIQTILSRLQGKPLMVLGLTRLTDERPGLLRLSDLSEEALYLMAGDLLGDSVPEADREGVKKFIVQRSGGNPFMLEVMATKAAEGWIKRDSQTKSWQFIGPDGRAVPASAESFLQAVIVPLPPDELKVLQIAAVSGQEIDFESLQALGLKDPAMAVPNLHRQNFLVRENDSKYAFRHALLRETVYRMMNRDEKERLHLAVARYLVDRGSKDYAVIAGHFEKGGRENHADASEYYHKAAGEAFQIGELSTAVRFYQGAFDLTQDPRRKLDVLKSWERALGEGGRYDECHRLCLLSLGLLDQIPGIEPVEVARVRYRTGLALVRLNRYDEAEEELSEALAIIGADPSSAKLRGSILIAVGSNHIGKGRFPEARHAYDEALALARAVDDKVLIGVALLGTCYVAGKVGDISTNLQAATEAAGLFREKGDLRQAVRALTQNGSDLAVLGAYEEAERTLREAESLSKRFGGRGVATEALQITLGSTLYRMGKRAEAIDQLERYLPKNPQHQLAVQNLAYLALAYADDGRMGEARRFAGQALQFAQDSKDQEGEATAQMLLAQLHLKEGEVEEARQASEEAVRIFTALGGVEEFDLMILLTHARILIQAGDGQGAWDSIDRAKILLEGRAAKIADERYRQGFLTGVAVNREILRLHQLWSEERHHLLSGAEKRFLEGFDFHPPSEIPAEARFVDLREPNRISIDDDKEHYSYAGLLLDLSPAAVVTALIKNKIKVPRNPKEVDLSPGLIEGVWGIGIECAPFFGRDGVLHYDVSWKSDSIGHNEVISQLVASRELLRDRRHMRDGVGFIELDRADFDKIETESGAVVEIDPDERPKRFQFGSIHFILTPTPEGKTILVLKMGRALYTQNPWNFLEGVVKAINEGRN